MKRTMGLMAAVCVVAACVPDDSSPGLSQGEVNQAIADHAAQGAAHHAKTVDAAEITSGTLDAARLPPITLDTASITSSGADGSVFAHDCVWAVSNDNTNVAFRSVTCPAGKHPIFGGCTSPSIAISVVASQPTDGGTIIADGDLVTDTDSWSCIFSAAATGHVARTLCCNY